MKIVRLAFWLGVIFSSSVFAETNPEERISGSSLDFEKVVDIPDSEKLENSANYLSEMKEVLGGVLEMLKNARDEKDIIKINCINEKLTSIKGLIRISEQADVTLQEAIAKGETDSITHEYHKIAISHQKVRVLKSEAEQCVGELAFVIGDTTVEVEKDKNIPEDDPTLEELPETEVIRPPAASPYT